MAQPMIDRIDSRIPNTSTAWQLWHRDTFDQEAPLSLQAAGTDILQGLYGLWLYTLKEGILEDGNASFSRFQLTWGKTPSTRVDVSVNPFDNPALLKLRHWAQIQSEDQERDTPRSVQTAGGQMNALVWRLAQLHYEYLQKSARWKAAAVDWSAEAREVLARVESVSGPEEF